MASSDSQIDKPQRGRPKRAELPDVNINTGAQSINTERASLDSLSRGKKGENQLISKTYKTKSFGMETGIKAIKGVDVFATAVT